MIHPILLRCLSTALVATAGVASILPAAAQDELVVVDQAELSAYWRADENSAPSLMLSGEGPQRYGCMALPFVIETDGRVAPGREPLLARIGQSPAGGDSAIGAIYPLVMGALPRFEPTWGAAPTDAIFSSRSIVFGDGRLRATLGEERWAQLHDRLSRQCRIDQLAGWMQRHDGKTVEQKLPDDPAQLLAQPE